MKNRELILILGGARAGKSQFAQRLAQERAAATGEPVSFIATAEALDDNMRARITRHQSERPAEWQTLEEPRQLDRVYSEAGAAGVVIVDCLTLFVANWLLATETEAECEARVTEILLSFLSLVLASNQTVLCVSNEVGLGVVPETPLGRIYRDVLGRVNQRVAQAADSVYLLVAGIPMKIK